MQVGRRRFVLGGAAAATLLYGGGAQAKDEDEVSPTEDLMREHGVLRRVLIVYDEIARRLDGKQELRAEWLADAAGIVRDFVEDYHEKDEEELLFPRFDKARKMTELVAILKQQHQVGRQITVEVARAAAQKSFGGERERKRLAERLRAFGRMYQAHSAREDTELFPAFRLLVGEKELARLQDVFEAKEKALPRGDFEKMVAEVARIEQALGIADLARFTPSL